MAAPVELVIPARTKDLGGFQVGRVLPYAKRRTVGPFIFWDEMGPAIFEPGRGIDVRPHPHIGLATVTYLFEGEIFHRDSVGSEQSIRPGDVNWMTAGRGIVHSERTGPEPRKQGHRMHGIQSWIALPAGDEEREPNFFHHPKGTLPTIDMEGAELRLIAGEAFGVASPVKVFSPMFYVHAELDAGAKLDLATDYEERAAYVVSGAVSLGGRTIVPGEMAVCAPGQPVTLEASSPANVMLLGGAPLEGPRHIWWNFVSSSRERIEIAKADWRNGKFPPVPGDDEFIPLPEE